MATMHSFITTDVDISADMLRKALKASVDKSFNMITVDGDMSTSDTVLILATGSAKNPKIIAESSHYKQFLDALEFVTIDLAKKIVKDGEGATKLVHVIVNGARDLEAAKKAARAVAESNLVKTAIFGMDANWGRIMAALGYSGAIFSPDQVDIWLEDLQLVKDGISANFSEDIARELFKKDELSIVIDLRSGEAKATMWTCDFSYDYVKINAAYRT
jgi:glutamate N-acetyltransferase/amino-acid N-acetyltransferase